MTFLKQQTQREQYHHFNIQNDQGYSQDICKEPTQRKCYEESKSPSLS